MRFGSWNINGIRSILKKSKDGKKVEVVGEDVISTLLLEKRLDVLCLQETRTSDASFISSLPEEIKEYSLFSIRKKGYSGVTVLTKEEVVSTNYNFSLFENQIFAFEEEKKRDFLHEGRLITIELEKYFIVNVYTPNSQDELKRLNERLDWDFYFRHYVYLLKEKCENESKTLIICGDFNVALNDIDIFNPRTHHHSAGFSDEERESFKSLLEDCGVIDTFRFLHPDSQKFTYWSNRFQSRLKNRGWRIDYFLIDKGDTQKLSRSEILNEYYGSDHCPIFLEMESEK